MPFNIAALGMDLLVIAFQTDFIKRIKGLFE